MTSAEARVERAVAELAAAMIEVARQEARSADEPARLVAVQDAAHILGVRRTLVYSLLDRGDLRSVKVGRRRLVSRASLDEYLGRAS